MNTVDGVVEQGVFRAGSFALPVEGRADGPVVLGIRPEALVLREQPTEHSIAFELDVVELVEPDTLLFVKKGEVSMVARIMRDVGERGAGRHGPSRAAAAAPAFLRRHERRAPAVSPLLHVVPLGIAALGWLALHRLNRVKGWFRIGELIFWDAIVLVVVFLVWLRWF